MGDLPVMWRLAFWWHGWRYRRQARHLAWCDWCGQGRCTCRAEVAGQVPEQDFYGSMTLEGERPLRLPDQEARESMLADLSPGALDEFYEWANYCTPHCPDDTCRAFGECAWRDDTPTGWPPYSDPDPWTAANDSGPGAGSSLAPGPDLMPWPFGFAPKHPERFRVLQAQAEPGPDTAHLAWLDRQLASHAEWARRMRGQVTGWGLEAAAA